MNKRVVFTVDGNSLEIEKHKNTASEPDAHEFDLLVFIGPEDSDGTGYSVVINKQDLIKGIGYLME